MLADAIQAAPSEQDCRITDPPNAENCSWNPVPAPCQESRHNGSVGKKEKGRDRQPVNVLEASGIAFLSESRYCLPIGILFEDLAFLCLYFKDYLKIREKLA